MSPQESSNPTARVSNYSRTIFSSAILSPSEKQKLKAKSFAVPGIEPGVIVEYQYDEIIKDDSANGERLIFQRDIPMQKVTYFVRPVKGSDLRYNSYNISDIKFSEDVANKGFYKATLTNVPSLKEEPYMPPDDEVRKWLYLHYANSTIFQWGRLSIPMSAFLKVISEKPEKEVKQKAAELTAGISSDEEKLKRIYDFVQKEIKNITYDRSLTEEQRENIKIKDAGDILKNRVATSGHIGLLFASLASAAGFEVGVVYSGDRSDIFFKPDLYPYSNFIHLSCIAVKTGKDWKFYSPGKPFLPFGKLFWFEENTTSMLIQKSGYNWKIIPLSDYKSTAAKRFGKLKLSEDGTLQGTIRIEYEGHQAINRRREGYLDSSGKREDDFRQEIKRQMSSAEITNLLVENFEDASKPLIYSYKVRIPNYAQKTGKRLFLQPGFFEYGSTPVFSSADRTQTIFFPYPWSEQDEILIEIPENFEFESAGSPEEVTDAEKIGLLNINIGIDKINRKLIYKRNFHFGSGGRTIFPVSAYPQLKRLFDDFNKADSYTLTIKQN